jgi:MFS family permease
LVGALVVGTAFPHLVKSLSVDFSWKYVVFSTSSLSVLGGLAMFLFIPNGPFRKPSQQLNLNAFLSGFKNINFRSAAFGYFGHMWELYTFWAFVPVMLSTYKIYFPSAYINVPLLSFVVIASGGLACVISGNFSQRFGVKRIATISLFLSCICCCVSPLFLFSSSVYVLLAFLFFWGLVVIADSPLFSTLVAQNAPEESRGTSLTIVNCIGFSITIASIQLINMLSTMINPKYLYTLLAAGPILGLIALIKNKQETT